MDNLSLLKKSKYFKELDNMDFNAILRCLQVRIKEFKQGDIIEYEGSPAKFAYIIIQGRARAISIDNEGTQTIIQDFEKDTIYGLEYKSTKSNYYKEELKATEDSIVAICDLFKLLTPCENRCRRHSIVISHCIEDFCRNIDTSKKRITHLGQNKTRDKIMSYLSQILIKPGKIYTIPYNREELAFYLGVERSALCVELSKLKKDGIIDYNKSEFKLIKKLEN